MNLVHEKIIKYLPEGERHNKRGVNKYWKLEINKKWRLDWKYKLPELEMYGLPAFPDVTQLEFGEVQQYSNGMRFIPITSNQLPLMIETDWLRCPFGLSRGIPGNPTYNQKIELTLNFNPHNERGKNFQDQMQELENRISNYMYENRREIELGRDKRVSQELTKREVKRMMTPIIKYPIDRYTWEINESWPPTFRARFITDRNHDTGEVVGIKTVVTNESGETIESNEDVLRPRCMCKVIMIANQIWINHYTFGIVFKLLKVKVKPPPGLPVGITLLPDDDSSSDEE